MTKKKNVIVEEPTARQVAWLRERAKVLGYEIGTDARNRAFRLRNAATGQWVDCRAERDPAAAEEGGESIAHFFHEIVAWLGAKAKARPAER